MRDKLSEEFSFLPSLADYFFKLIYCPGYVFSLEEWNENAQGGILMCCEDHVWTVAPERTNILLA